MTTLEQKQLFEQIDILPVELKTKLIDRLLNSINKIDTSTENLWIKEINRRKLEIENGKISLIDGKEVFKKIQEKFNQ
jgi:hypothetical protein